MESLTRWLRRFGMLFFGWASVECMVLLQVPYHGVC